MSEELRQIEQIALDKVTDYEISQGRKSIHEKKRGAGYDILSDDRKIEVKGTIWKWKVNRSSFQYVSENERTNATHLYMVCDVRGEKELFIFEMEKIRHALTPEIRYRLNFAKCREMESNESKELHT